jgi:hypothetical protein
VARSRAVVRDLGDEVRVDRLWMRAAAARIPPASLHAVRNNLLVEYP